MRHWSNKSVWEVQLNLASAVIGSDSLCLPDTLLRIDNGLGGITEVFYKPTTQLGIQGIHYPVYVVAEVKVTDTHPSGSGPEVYVQQFAYEDAYYEAGEREFRGFAKVTVTDPVTGNYTETTFHQGKGEEPDALKGKIKTIRAYDGNGEPIFEETNAYEVAGVGPDNTTIAYPKLVQVDTTVYENGESISVRTRYAYDGVGNVVRETSDGDLAVSGDERTALTAYTRAYGYGSEYNAVRRQELRDDLDAVVRRSDYAYDTRGNQTAKTDWLETGEDPVTEYTYDDYGNRLTVTDPLDHTTTTTYETVYYQYPETVTNELGHITQYVYDARFGVIESRTDPNGNTTSYSYDPLVRRLTVTDPYDRVVTTYSYPDFNTTITTDFYGVRTTEYIDGLRRLYRTVTDGEDGALAKDVVTEKVYDERGHLAAESMPHYADAGEVSWIRYTYDLRGREVERLEDYPGTEDDAVSETEYLSPLSVKVIDPMGHATTTVRDVYDNVLEVVDHTAGGDYHTYYSYDAADRLVQLTDDHGNLTGITYDTLGRKVALDDPDTGPTTYTYDPVGNLITQTDNKGQVTTLTYDALNRVTARAYADPNTPDVTYLYDEPTATNGLGRLTTLQDGAGTTTYNYDKLGRVVETTQTIDGTPYTTQTAYDAVGRLEEQIYPDGETLTYGYDANSGLLESVTGAAAYVADITYDAQGRKTSLLYGSGVRTDYTYGNDERLERILSTNTATLEVLQDLTYDYDKVGNITQVDDAVYGYLKTFRYDDLDRLVQADGVPYTPALTWEYDSIGNMTFNSQVGSYTYGENGAGPHAVTTAGANAYAYDANGNMVSGPGRTLFYDQENRLILSDVGGTPASYVYDHSGRRVKQVTPDGTTVYVSQAYEVQTGAESHVAKHIFADGQRVASVKDAAASYYLPDHLGSSNLMTNASGEVVQHIEYAPFGQVVLQGGQDVTAYKFTGKELDGSGLYYYGARYYDPALCRFITADSIVPDGHNSQKLNRYAYTLNNPVKLVDPTGHVPIPLILVGGGALFGVGSLFVSDLIQGTWSDPADYIGAAVGGAVSGFGLMVGQPVLGGAAGGAAETAISGFLKGTPGEEVQGELVQKMTMGAALSVVPLPTGRGSAISTAKMLTTRFQKNQIAHVSANSALKMMYSTGIQSSFGVISELAMRNGTSTRSSSGSASHGPEAGGGTASYPPANFTDMGRSAGPARQDALTGHAAVGLPHIPPTLKWAAGEWFKGPLGPSVSPLDFDWFLRAFGLKPPKNDGPYTAA